MHLSNSQLRSLESLKELGFSLDLSAGGQVARGFADLGYEQFLIMNNGKLLALYTGTITELKPEHQQFFFNVPAVDRLLLELHLLGWDIQTINYRSAMSCEVVLSADGQALSFKGESFYAALVEAFKTALEVNK